MSSTLPNTLNRACRELQKLKPRNKMAAFVLLVPLIFMMVGTGDDEDYHTASTSAGSARAVEAERLPGNLNGACRGDFGGFCVPRGMCSPENKIQTNHDSCDAGMECCTKELNMKLCANRGGECVDIGSCGEGVALFREAEDCNRARHGKDCCIWT